MAYEDAIFFGISLLLVLLAGFCVGVERGRHLAASQVTAAPQAKESAAAPQDLSVAAASVPAKGETASRVAAAVPAQFQASYAIQLASFVDKQIAQTEAQRLHRLGFSPQIVKQGKYYELRVSGYRSREDALGPLATLRKTYRDGFIKKLSS